MKKKATDVLGYTKEYRIKRAKQMVEIQAKLINSLQWLTQHHKRLIKENSKLHDKKIFLSGFDATQDSKNLQN